MDLFEVFEELNKLYEAKEDQAKFIAKFGQDRFDRFNKLKSKLANVKDPAGKSVTTDILYYVKNTSEKDLDDLLDRAENRQYVANTTTEYDIEGKRIPEPANTKKLLVSNQYYDVYKVTDYTDAIDLARRKLDASKYAFGYWCISGRYQLNDDDAVKVSQAEQYFNEYLDSKYLAYYFCMPKDDDEHKLVICPLAYDSDFYQAFDAYDKEIWYTDDLPNTLPNIVDSSIGFDLSKADLGSDEDEYEEDDEEEIEDEEYGTPTEDDELNNFIVEHNLLFVDGRDIDANDIIGPNLLLSKTPRECLDKLLNELQDMSQEIDSEPDALKTGYSINGKEHDNVGFWTAMLEMAQVIDSCTTTQELDKISTEFDDTALQEGDILCNIYSADEVRNIDEYPLYYDGENYAVRLMYNDRTAAVYLNTILAAKYAELEGKNFRG